MPQFDVEFRREALSSNAASRLIPALNAELSEQHPEDGTPQHFRLDAEEIQEGRGAFLVVYANGDAVGCGAIRRIDESTAEVKRMYVEPSARGRGLGRSLLAQLEVEAHRLGIDRLVLETGSRQAEALALYRQAGFAVITAFGHYQEHPLSVFMEKKLQVAQTAPGV